MKALAIAKDGKDQFGYLLNKKLKNVCEKRAKESLEEKTSLVKKS